MATISFTREIKLNEVSAQSLIKKIERDRKNKTVLNSTDVERKLKESKILLKQIFSR